MFVCNASREAITFYCSKLIKCAKQRLGGSSELICASAVNVFVNRKKKKKDAKRDLNVEDSAEVSGWRRISLVELIRV